MSSDDNEVQDNKMLKGLIKQAKRKPKEQKRFDDNLQKKIASWDREQSDKNKLEEQKLIERTLR
jgi:type I site-specific restriction-modification system R (restriction) subunit